MGVGLVLAMYQVYYPFYKCEYPFSLENQRNAKCRSNIQLSSFSHPQCDHLIQLHAKTPSLCSSVARLRVAEMCRRQVSLYIYNHELVIPFLLSRSSPSDLSPSTASDLSSVSSDKSPARNFSPLSSLATTAQAGGSAGFRLAG